MLEDEWSRDHEEFSFAPNFKHRAMNSSSNEQNGNLEIDFNEDSQ